MAGGAVEIEDHPALDRIPHLHGPLPVGRDKSPAVGAEGDGRHWTEVWANQRAPARLALVLQEVPLPVPPLRCAPVEQFLHPGRIAAPPLAACQLDVAEVELSLSLIPCFGLGALSLLGKPSLVSLPTPGRRLALSRRLGQNGADCQGHDSRPQECTGPRHPRLMPPRPPRQPRTPALPVGRDRLVGQPPLDVVGQGTRRGVAARSVPSPWP